MSLKYKITKYMPIKYYLHPNAISQNPDSQKAVILPHKVHNSQGIIEEMLKKGTTLSEADIIASMQLLFEVVTEQLQEGNHVNLPIVNLKPGISGVFNGLSDRFDPERHKTKATASIGQLVKNGMKRISTEKITRQLTVPILSEFKDVQSGELNHIITPGSIARISGNYLKFNRNNPDEGVFFVSEANEVFKVTQIAELHPKKLIIGTPSLPAGNYTIEVKVNFGNTGSTLRKGTLNTLLKVL